MLLLSGCSKPPFETAPVTGICQLEGEPISDGWIQFSPIPVNDQTMPGKPAIARIQADGTFTLSTYGTGDGAVVGRHRIRLSEPSMPDPKEIAEGAYVPRKHGCQLKDDNLELEVKKSVSQHFVIELKRKQTGNRRPNPEET